MKKFCFIIFSCFFVGCNLSEKKQKTIITSEVNFYKQSEMAALMLLMYKKNAENKELIIHGKQPKQFPKEFLKIHTAKLTDSTDRDGDFKTFSDYYLQTLKAVFVTSESSLKEKHNNVVNSCIACHEATCIGPIPKIKKLLIK